MPERVAQEVWGLAIAYNLVRHEMEAVAQECRVAPTRISFLGILAVDPRPILMGRSCQSRKNYRK